LKVKPGSFSGASDGAGNVHRAKTGGQAAHDLAGSQLSCLDQRRPRRLSR
jgi:hypothetical protein